MKYCVKCGKPMEEQEVYCGHCGAPANGVCHPTYHPTYHPVPPNVADPDSMYPFPAQKLAAGIAGAVYGLCLAGGGVYAMIAFTQYTKWAIAGGLGGILAGVLCLVHAVGLLRRFAAQRKSL